MWFLCVHVCFCNLPVLNLFLLETNLTVIYYFSYFTHWENEISIFSIQLSIFSWPTNDLRWSFHCLRLNKLHLPVLIFVVMIKGHDQKQVGEESIFLYTSHHSLLSKDIMAETQGRDPCSRSHGGTLTTNYMITSYSAWFFYITRTNSLGKAPPTVSWAFPYQTSIMKMHRRMMGTFWFFITKCGELTYN